MDVLAVIPARMAATRLPGKPLAMIGDKTLVERVYACAKDAGVFSDVIVASDSEEVLDVVAGFGGRGEMTSDQHQSGTDRVAEVADRHPEFDVVANVQGDLVDPDPRLLAALIDPFTSDNGVEMSTVAVPLAPDLLEDPNSVKVVCDAQGDALYFSRSLIPHGTTEGLHHLGLYAFRRDTLTRFTQLPAGRLETQERLEQLRALENGIDIRVSVVDVAAVREVNTSEDLEAARQQVSA
jgi:3-deoxy-manno-octulosonate cytidylyltransferase (CMP-KDO synthetase)